MLNTARCEARLQAEFHEVTQPALQLVETGRNEEEERRARRLRRERRQTEGRFRVASGWRIGTW